MLLLQKPGKPLAVMQGLRPMFFLRCRPAPKQASACRPRRRNRLRSSGLHHSKENLKNMRYLSCPFFWYSLHGSVLLPRRLGYKEYLRISSDILLPRKLGSKNILKYPPISSYLASSVTKNILKYSPIFSIPEPAR